MHHPNEIGHRNENGHREKHGIPKRRENEEESRKEKQQKEAEMGRIPAGELEGSYQVCLVRRAFPFPVSRAGLSRNRRNTS